MSVCEDLIKDGVCKDCPLGKNGMVEKVVAWMENQGAVRCRAGKFWLENGGGVCTPSETIKNYTMALKEITIEVCKKI